MQFSADFVALGLHQADVYRAERELGLRMGAAARGSDDGGGSSEPVAHRSHPGHRRALRLAVR